uniref:CSON007897 protein n=1 Tax=Culicoides sonorensis TaxID=179676 RepID=A0A336KDN9_CULSO
MSKSILSQHQKYCNLTSCQRHPHIGCPGNARRQCPLDAVEIEMTNKMKTFIVGTHNHYRNTLAGGQLTGLPKAKSMPTLKWDSELASLAKLNAMRCKYGHDQCHNTARYNWSGQNVARSFGYSNNTKAIESAMKNWWNEYQQAKKSDIQRFGHSIAKIGHFTAMAQDRTDRIGCAAVKFNRNHRIFVCNYSFTNLQDSYVYKIGQPTSGCRTGKNNAFRNLCSTNERVNPNP